MTVPEQALLPCPFCGSSKLKSGDDDKVVAVWCQDCGATGPNHYNSKADWNKRAALPLMGVQQTNEMSTTAQCTICAGEPSPGFYTGCLIADGHGDGKWLCDGKGNLTRPPAQSGSVQCREDVARIIDPHTFLNLEHEQQWCRQHNKDEKTWCSGLLRKADQALAKADAILALPKPAGQPVEGKAAIIEECAKVIENFKYDEWHEDYGRPQIAKAVAAAVRALPAPASPHEERNDAEL